MRQTCPRLSPGCSFHAFDNGGRKEEYVLCMPNGRQFKVSALARRILESLDGCTELEYIVSQLNGEGVAITLQQLRSILEGRFASLGVIEDGSAASAPAAATSSLLLTWNLIPGRVVAWSAAGFAWLYGRLGATLALLAVVVAHAFVYRVPFDRAPMQVESYLLVIGLCLLSILFHELGHAAALSRFGGVPGEIGFGLFLLMPTFYTDVSQLWRFPRGQRMVVDLGGVYFQQIAFSGFALVAHWTGRPEVYAACRLIDVMVLTAVNPLFRFDGYWFLVDYLAIPKLHSIAFKAPFAQLWKWLHPASRAVAIPKLSRPARVVFWSYSVLSSSFLGATLWIVFNYLRSTAESFPRVFPQMFAATVAAFLHGHWLSFINQLLVLFFVLTVPVSITLGVGIYTVRLARFAGTRLARILPLLHLRLAPGRRPS